MEEKKILKQIQDIVEQLVQKYRPIKIILFGSAARGEYDRLNDLDFLVLKEDVPYRGIDRMREVDELIERDIAIDILIYKPHELENRIQLGDPFIKAILKEGRVLYG